MSDESDLVLASGEGTDSLGKGEWDRDPVGQALEGAHVKGMSGEVRGDVGFEGCVGLCRLMFTRISARSDPSIFCA